ncbi:MAG TPA: carbohydrate ABC transporter permease [Spirochaetia bacterium]|nr:carbohydrate ABC transporter permease [Spirochaetia bacterium]
MARELRSRGDLVFDTTNVIIILLFCITTIYPFLYLLSLSLSSINVPVTKVHIIPPEFSLANYQKVLASRYIGSGFVNTIARVVVGTSLTLVAVILTAYPLSKKYFPNRTFWTGVVVFTMFFTGGLIPRYLLVVRLGMINTIWALVLVELVPTFTMIIARNFFMTLPESLEESVKIDGGGVMTILLHIVIPVSKPIIAVVTLWTAVWHWNAWFDSLIYMRDASRHVLQIVLRRIVLEGTQEMIEMQNLQQNVQPTNSEMVKAATIMVVTIPIVMLYPFLQKYFVKGVLVGSLKG